jgi:5-methylcytosine-specific restriction endonuclease McrA
MGKTNKELQSSWYNKHKGTPAFLATMREKQKRYMRKHTFARLTRNLKTCDATSQLTKFDLWKLAKKQKLICPLTGRRLTNDSISIDHIIHLSNGGTSLIDNIRLVDYDANMARRALSDSQFIKLCQDVTKKNCQPCD